MVTKSYIPKQRAFIYEWIAAVARALKKRLGSGQVHRQHRFADRFPVDIGQEGDGNYIQRTNVIKFYHYLTHKEPSNGVSAAWWRGTTRVAKQGRGRVA